MGSGDEASAPSIPAGDLDRGDVANGRRVAQDSVPHDASEVGAPWEGLPEGARQRAPRRGREAGGSV
jgi:hypothetical protein